jgi:hypothetical protein
MAAERAIPWLTEAGPEVQRSLALAVINAVAAGAFKSEGRSAERAEELDAAELPIISAEDVLGVVGYITPIVRAMAGRARACHIFDNSLQHGVKPPHLQGQLLPECSVVFITGTCFLNHSAGEVLSYCRNAREVVIVGPSTPLFAELFSATPVTILAGSLWPGEQREEIFRHVSQAAGIHQLSSIMRKVTVPISRGF